MSNWGIAAHGKEEAWPLFEFGVFELVEIMEKALQIAWWGGWRWPRCLSSMNQPIEGVSEDRLIASPWGKSLSDFSVIPGSKLLEDPG